MNSLQKQVEKLKKEKRRLKHQVNARLLKYITAGFGVAAALAWNDVIKAFINYFFPLGRDTMLAKTAYALVLTILLVIISIFLAKILGKKKKP